jgi:hypothetical protein
MELYHFLLSKYVRKGLSISSILLLPSGPPKIRAFGQLLEEWEYYQLGITMQSVKSVMAKQSTSTYPQIMVASETTAATSSFDPVKPSVYKFQNNVVYEFLQVPHIPFSLNYREVLFALLDSLSELYEGFRHVETYR